MEYREWSILATGMCFNPSDSRVVSPEYVPAVMNVYHYCHQAAYMHQRYGSDW